MGWPAKEASPALARYNPVSTLKKVVFPEPLGPIRPRISPSSSSKLNRSSATSPPKRRVTSRQVSSDGEDGFTRDDRSNAASAAGSDPLGGSEGSEGPGRHRAGSGTPAESEVFQEAAPPGMRRAPSPRRFRSRPAARSRPALATREK